MKAIFLIGLLSGFALAVPMALKQAEYSAVVKSRDGTTEFDPDFFLKFKRDGTTEFDPDFFLKY
ncbi:hypothetical protein F4801DRAFT_584093 [Xylaria longipes]|nr:hypothetical protein F4801DRAFT_584093 [Xylaria longipes]